MTSNRCFQRSTILIYDNVTAECHLKIHVADVENKHFFIRTASDEEEEGAVGGQAKPAEVVQEKKEEEKEEVNDDKDDESAGWFASWGIPSGITKVVENTTKAVESTVCRDISHFSFVV